MLVRIRTPRPHMRAGFAVGEEIQEVEVTEEQLKLLVRDKEIMVEGHPNVSRAQAEAEDKAAYEAREAVAVALVQAERSAIDAVRKQAIDDVVRRMSGQQSPTSAVDEQTQKVSGKKS